jgi:predicted PurR-regulated permease PerM
MIVLLLLAWRIRDVFLLAFGALILSTALRAASFRMERWLGLPQRWAVAATVLLLVGVGVAGAFLVGDRLVQQFAELRERLPAAIESAQGWLNESALGGRVLDVWEGTQNGDIPWGRIGGAAGVTIGAIGNAALIALLAIFLAADPGLYRNGFIRLAPCQYRSRIGAAMAAAGDGLGSWLMGQGISMLFVGVATAVGLALLGSPLALSLGVIAGVFAFIPFFGPIASGALAVALAFIEGPQTALYVGVLCLVIQQIEGNILMPFVQRWAVSLPPVLGLVSVVVFGLLFGVMGVILATPLMVVVMILVQRLYIQEVLESP